MKFTVAEILDVLSSRLYNTASGANHLETQLDQEQVETTLSNIRNIKEGLDVVDNLLLGFFKQVVKPTTDGVEGVPTSGSEES